MQIIAKQAWNTSTLMLQHILSKAYYTQKSIDFGLTPPTFDHEVNRQAKQYLLIK
jgi:hypothetical protein